jgi:hypothetical protein
VTLDVLLSIWRSVLVKTVDEINIHTVSGQTHTCFGPGRGEWAASYCLILTCRFPSYSVPISVKISEQQMLDKLCISCDFLFSKVES